jgi:hypothetical protein
MSVMRARTFLLGAYHDLPNVLFIGSLILGTLTGYLPLVWLALGMLMNAGVIQLFQSLFQFLFPTWTQIIKPANQMACDIYSRASGFAILDKNAVSVVAPSHWIGAATFFTVFIIYNSIRVMLKPAASGVETDKVDNRRAYTMSTAIIGMCFLGLIFMRGFTGCDTLFGFVTALIIGSSIGIGFWHLLDACGSGNVPDVLNVINSMAPSGSGTVPVVCTT